MGRKDKMGKFAAMKKMQWWWMAVLLLVVGCSSTNDPDTSGIPSERFLGVGDTNLLDGGAFGGSDRENWQQPQMVISSLGDLSDKTVADIGAGTGYFSIRLARKARKVIAIDIEEKYLSYIRRRLSKTRDHSQLNVEPRLTEPDNPNLEAGEADVVLVVNTYPYIENRVEYFSRVRSGLAPGGQLVIIDFKYRNLPIGPDQSGKLPAAQVEVELDSAGFETVGLDTTGLPYQYRLTASPRTGGS